jgi:hypothetical protein
MTDPTIVGALADDGELTDRVVRYADDLHRHGSAALQTEVRS